MNPNQQALDPKLKEAYDRVMGVGTQPTAAATQPQPVEPQAEGARDAEGARGTAAPVQPVEPTAQAPISQSPVTPTPMQPTEAAQAAVPETKNYVAGSEEKKSGISPVIIGLGVFVFLIVYTLFWVRFFNIPLPI